MKVNVDHSKPKRHFLPSSCVCKTYSFAKGPWEVVTAATAK